MGTNSVAKLTAPDFVDNRVNERAIETEQVGVSPVYSMPFYQGKTTTVDTLGRTSQPAENRHSDPLSTFFSLKLKKEEREKREGSLPESFGPKVDVDEAVTADLSHLTPDAATATLSTIARFWADSASHDRTTMRTRWSEGIYAGMPRELAAPIIDGAEFTKLGEAA